MLSVICGSLSASLLLLPFPLLNSFLVPHHTALNCTVQSHPVPYHIMPYIRYHTIPESFSGIKSEESCSGIYCLNILRICIFSG